MAIRWHGRRRRKRRPLNDDSSMCKGFRARHRSTSRKARRSGVIPGPINVRKILLEKEKKENEEEDLMWEVGQLILDLAGILDPTPISDGASGAVALCRGDWRSVLISVVSMVPYIGDLAKLKKLPIYAKTMRKALNLAQYNNKWARKLRPMMYKLQPVLNKIVELGDDILPKAVLSKFRSMQKAVNRFVKYNPKNKSFRTKKDSGGTSGKQTTPTPSGGGKKKITQRKKKSVEGEGDSGKIGNSESAKADAVKTNNSGVTIKAQFKEGMDTKEFNRKINRVQGAIDESNTFTNIPHNVTDAERRSLTRKYRKDVTKRINTSYKNNPTAKENALKRLRNSDIDHIQDLQLGGQNVRSNLKSLDSRVNQDLGRQFSTQIPKNVNEPIIRLDVKGYPKQ